jgi:cytochrome c556
MRSGLLPEVCAIVVATGASGVGTAQSDAIASESAYMAAGIATQAAEAATAITTAINTQAFQEIAAASDALGGACQACHTEYREKTDGGFRITPGVL